MARDNRTIGRFHLDGIPPAPRGIPQVEVIFDIDANGILHVTAKDKATGKSQNIRIEASSGLNDEEIQRMKREAEANAEADRKAKEEADKVNQADSMIFNTEKQLKEFGDKIPADKKAAIESALEQVKEAHKNKDLTAIDSSLQTLNAAWEAASKDLYNASQQAGAEGQPQGEAANPTNAGDGVTDVPYEEVK
jgi:molecular chaperone DnaK